ncbi:Solute carrier family 10 member 6 [Nymphon striatum]|nr:Solute carrier family 10 member 6 [Nymphon striatum]
MTRDGNNWQLFPCEPFLLRQLHLSPFTGVAIFMELNYSSNGSFNGTSEEQFETPVLKTVLDIFLIVIVVFIMISMGCTITKEEIWKHIKTPISPIIGMVSQFVILPLCSYGIIYALDLTVNVAIGMLVLSCCPGGTMSNLFTYWTDGDEPMGSHWKSLQEDLESRVTCNWYYHDNVFNIIGVWNDAVEYAYIFIWMDV